MSSSSKRGAVGLWLGLVVAAVAPAYVFITDESGIYVVTWPRGEVPMVNNLDDTTVLADGTTQHGSAEAALAEWNTLLGNVQFSSTSGAVGSFQSGNGVNEIVEAGEIDVYVFGPGTLAVTLSYRDGNYRTESDVVFNSAFTWDAYRGPLQSGRSDLLRVALHEFGHVLGLDHPDQASPVQAVTALMNSTVSNVDALQTDDIDGGRYLYGAVDSPPVNDDFANAIRVTLDENGTASVTGTTVQAGAEPGEPLLDPDYPSGRSAWWTWTAPTSGLLHANTLGSRFDTFMGAFTGDRVDALELVAKNDDVDPGVIRTSTLSFRVEPGTAYHFLVDGWDGYEGGVQFNLELLADSGPTIEVATPRIVGERGEPVTLAVNATAEFGGALSYQWSRNNRLIGGATSAELILPNFRNADAGAYAVTVTEAGGGTGTGLVYVLPDYDGTDVVTWGGAPTDGKRALPTFAQAVLQVELGGAHGLALQRDGTVLGWGSPAGLEAFGQETPPEGLTDVVAIAAGERHSLALRADGTVVAWGSNEYNQLLVPWDLRDVIAIGAGAFYSVALRADGEVVIWGYATESGQELAVPEAVSNVVRLASGSYFVLAELADGTVTAWGDPNDLKLVVPALSDVRDLSAGTNHALAVSTGGVVSGWGDNSGGQLDAPGDLGTVVAVMAGADFSVALLDDATVRAWGSSADDETAVPLGLDRVVQIETGRATSVALRDLSAPVIFASPVATGGSEGAPIALTVDVAGTPPLMYQWWHDGTEIAEADAATLTLSGALADAGDYYVTVSNGMDSVSTVPVEVVVLPTGVNERAQHGVTQMIGEGVANDSWLLAGRAEWLDGVTAVQWQTLVPAGWTVTGDVTQSAAAAVAPTVGEDALAEWSWTEAPAVAVTVAMRLSATEPFAGTVELASLVSVTRTGQPVQVLAEPDPLLLRSSRHSADRDGDRTIDLSELLRVIELYNTRAGTERTGVYHRNVETEDGYAPGTSEATNPAGFHSADIDRDGALSLSELLRVIELYNTRSGTTRTGAYHIDAATEDGFTPDN